MGNLCSTSTFTEDDIPVEFIDEGLFRLLDVNSTEYVLLYRQYGVYPPNHPHVNLQDHLLTILQYS